MIEKFKKKAPFLFVALLLTVLACSVHEEALNDTHAMYWGKNHARLITGNDVIPFKNILLSEIEKSRQITFLKEVDSSLVTGNFGAVDYSEIFEVIDSLDVKNYSFRIVNHPNDNFNIFHNLVLTEKDGAFEITLMRYEMEDAFALMYRKDPTPETLKNFKGKIRSMSLSAADPCEDIEIAYPNTGGGSDDGGGGFNPGGPPPGPAPGPSNPGGGGPAFCYDMEISFVCSCGRSYSSWGSYTGSMCGDGSNPGYTVTMVISYSLSASCRLAGEPCIPDGEIAVLPDSKFLKCVTKEKLAEIFPTASLENRKKLADNIRIYGAYFGINTKEEVCHFLSQVGAETDGLITLNATEDLDYSTAAAAIKSWPSKFTATNEPGKIHPAPYLHNPQGLANFVYGTRNGNQGGADGWDFRGRGVLQLTGRGNYEAYQVYLISIGLGWTYYGPDNITNPDGIHAVLSGMWFFKNTVLDKMEITSSTTADRVTKKINRYTDKVSKQKRRNYFNSAVSKLNC
jgi:putative chitinase